MKQHLLFPTEVYTDNVLLDTSLMINFLYKKSQIDKGVHISNRGGWQSNSNLHQFKEFEPLCKYINNLFSTNLQNPGYIMSMWGNISSKYHYNTIHHHGKHPLFWSGVYYLQTDFNCGDLVLSSYWDTDYTKKFTPKLGNLILFPASLSHSVEPNLSNSDRISIAFNFKINSDIDG